MARNDNNDDTSISTVLITILMLIITINQRRALDLLRQEIGLCRVGCSASWQLVGHADIYIYIYIYVYTHTCIYIYIYIYIHRERAREKITQRWSAFFLAAIKLSHTLPPRGVPRPSVCVVFADSEESFRQPTQSGHRTSDTLHLGANL